MKFIVYLYKEGPPMDGESFACGPYSDEDEADSDAAFLMQFGQARVLPLHLDSNDIAAAIA